MNLYFQIGTVASLHSSPKPLQASSSLGPMGLGLQNSNKRQRQYSSISDEDSDDSDLEYDQDELDGEVGLVERNRDFYAQLEQEEKVNAQVVVSKLLFLRNCVSLPGNLSGKG